MLNVGASSFQFIPEGISNDKKCDILVLRIAEDLVAVGLDHLTVGYCDRASIV